MASYAQQRAKAIASSGLYVPLVTKLIRWRLLEVLHERKLVIVDTLPDHVSPQQAPAENRLQIDDIGNVEESEPYASYALASPSRPSRCPH
jgi:hypothetical protein